MEKVYNRINWENEPSTRSPINEDNLNKMDYALNEIDNRVVELSGYQERAEHAVETAEESAKKAQSYAVGGTGTRENEDTDNAEYYAKQAKKDSESASSAVSTTSANASSAAESASSASLSATTATNAVDSIAGYATTAQNSAAAADTSAYNASQSELNAGLSAQTAQSNAENAEGYKNDAEKAAQHAEDAYSNAQALVDGIPEGYSALVERVGQDDISEVGESITNAILKLKDKEIDLTFDTTPTEGSLNPVTSGGIKKAIDDATPEGYYTFVEDTNERLSLIEEEQETQNVHLNTLNGEIEAIQQEQETQNVHFATGSEITVDTKKGGSRFVGAKGGQHKSANLIEKIEQGTLGTDGSELASNARVRTSFVQVKSGTKYTFKANASFTVGIYGYIYDTSKNNGSILTTGGWETNQYTFTASKDGYVRLIMRNNANDESSVTQSSFTEVMLNEGSTALPYEPYGIHTSGSMGLVDLASLSWSKYGNNFYYQFNESKGAVSENVPANIYVENNHYRVVASNGNNLNRGIDKSISITSAKTMWVIDSEYANKTVNEFKNSLKGVQFAYELADGATPSQYAEVIKEHGKNFWDEVWQTGQLNDRNGNITSSSDQIVSVNHIKIKPSTQYIGITQYPFRICYYDEYKNYLNYVALTKVNEVFTTPSNAHYMRFFAKGGYGITYKNDLAIYEYEEGKTYSYEPYYGKTVIIPLKYPLASINGIANSIDKNGKHYKIGCVDLGTLNGWYRRDSDGWFLTPDIISISKHPYWFSKNNILCDKYDDKIPSKLGDYEQGIMLSDSGYLCIRDTSLTDLASFKTAISGVMLYYELATEETEPLDESFYELESYEGKTYIDTADTYAKATLSVGYGKSDTVATALGADNKASAEVINRIEDMNFLNIFSPLGKELPSVVNLNDVGVGMWTYSAQLTNVANSPNSTAYYMTLLCIPRGNTKERLYQIALVSKSDNTCGVYARVKVSELYWTAWNQLTL